MSEYIKKDDILSALVEVEYLGRRRMMVSASKIDELPTADVIDRKRGEWTKEKRVYGVSKPFCSRCGAVALSEMINLGSYKTCESNFCPNCGCRMKGADDE